MLNLGAQRLPQAMADDTFPPLPDTLFLQVLDEATDIVMITRSAPLEDPGPEIVYVNRAFTEVTGYTAEEAIGRTPRMLQGPDTDRGSLDYIRNALDAGRSCYVTVLNYAKDGRRYWLDLKIFPIRDTDGRLTHFAAIQRDKTAEIEAAEELYEAATVDELTHVGNRRHFTDNLEQAILRSRRYGHPLTVLIFDLDHFKVVNDSHGHAAGDQVLKTVAGAARPMIREPDSLGRIGGEEFAVLLNETPLAGGVVVAERLRQAIGAAVCEHRSVTLRVTASFGCAELAAGDDADSLLARADKALYAAKQNGRNRVEVAA